MTMCSAVPFIFLAILALLLPVTRARTWSSTKLPSPLNDPDNICKREGKESIVCDPDGYLSSSDADTIDALALFVAEGTHGFQTFPCHDQEPKGAQIAVAIFGSMPSGTANVRDRANTFARDLHDRWGVGNDNCQNGIVIIVAVDDKALGFSIGEGLNETFSGSLIPVVTDIMKRRLKRKEYGDALKAGVIATGNILKKNVVRSGLNVYPFLLALVGAVSCLVCTSAVTESSTMSVLQTRQDRFKRFKRMLNKINDDRIKALKNAYVSTSCPICLEDFASIDAQSRQVDEFVTQRADIDDADETTTLLPRQTNLTTSPDIQPRNNVQLMNALMNAPESEIRTLPCGHIFHAKCIAEWFVGKSEADQQCPICRQPTETTSTSIEQRTNNRQRSGWDAFEPERNFRIQRLQSLFPDISRLSQNILNSNEGPSYDGDNVTTSNEFTAVNTADIENDARASGHRGSTFSFGGLWHHGGHTGSSHGHHGHADHGHADHGFGDHGGGDYGGGDHGGGDHGGGDHGGGDTY